MVKTIEMSLCDGALAVVTAVLLLCVAVLLSRIQNRLGRALSLPAWLTGSHAPTLGKISMFIDAALPARLTGSHAPSLGELSVLVGEELPALGSLHAPPLLERALIVDIGGVGRGEVQETVVGARGKEADVVGVEWLDGRGGGLAESVNGALELPAWLAGSHAPGSRGGENGGGGCRQHNKGELHIEECLR